MATVERQEVKAVAKWVRMSPRKARLVAEHIRGRTVPEARTVLAFTPRAAARELEKVLRSAVANAEANHSLAGDDLVVSAAFVDEGPVMKTGTCLRPSWTAIVCPTISGNTVEARDQVLIICFVPDSFIVWIRPISRSSTKGPFLLDLLKVALALDGIPARADCGGLRPPPLHAPSLLA